MDHYTIGSLHARLWLPAATAVGSSSPTGASSPITAAGATASGGGEQRFLLEAPSSEGAAYGASLAQEGQPQSSETPTIALAELKVRIVELEEEIDAGDGSEEYRECVLFKYVWDGGVRYHKEQLALRGEGYHYKRQDHALDSGLPAGSMMYTFELAHHYVEVHGESIPSKYAAMFRLGGRDKDLFDVEYPGEVSLARPLPSGTYKFYFDAAPARYIVCDGKSERNGGGVNTSSP